MTPPIPSQQLRDYSKDNKEGLKTLLQNRHITAFDSANKHELIALLSLYELRVLPAGVTIEKNHISKIPILKEVSAWWKGTKLEVVKIADQ